jgi:hypothetical protein
MTETFKAVEESIKEFTAVNDEIISADDELAKMKAEIAKIERKRKALAEQRIQKEKDVKNIMTANEADFEAKRQKYVKMVQQGGVNVVIERKNALSVKLDQLEKKTAEVKKDMEEINKDLLFYKMFTSFQTVSESIKASMAPEPVPAPVPPPPAPPSLSPRPDGPTFEEYRSAQMAAEAETAGVVPKSSKRSKPKNDDGSSKKRKERDP